MGYPEDTFISLEPGEGNDESATDMSILLNPDLRLDPRILDELQHVFAPADRPVTPRDSVSLIMYRAGQKSVVDFIRRILDEQRG